MVPIVSSSAISLGPSQGFARSVDPTRLKIDLPLVSERKSPFWEQRQGGGSRSGGSRKISLGTSVVGQAREDRNGSICALQYQSAYRSHMGIPQSEAFHLRSVTIETALSEHDWGEAGAPQGRGNGVGTLKRASLSWPFDSRAKGGPNNVLWRSQIQSTGEVELSRKGPSRF
jgi:hypothetical protein